MLRKCKCTVKGAAVWGGILIVLYGMLTGFGVSACRAIGMYLIHMLGEIWGKTYDMLTAMGVLAIVLLWENPRLVYHSGYLLSFASVCGVGLLAPGLKITFEFLRPRPYDSMMRRVCKKRMEQVVDSLSVSLAVTLFTLPIQLFFFYKVPVYSVLLNLLVIPFVSVVMVVGFVVMIFPGLQFLCPVESLIFAWFEWLCNAFEYFPGHTWVTGRPPMWRILVYYVALMLLVCGRRERRNRDEKVILGTNCKGAVISGIILAMVLFVGNRGRGNTQVVFLDVGQGDCICVLTKEGNCYLFDGGSSSKRNVGEKIIIPFLLYSGVAKVDGVFVSHPDADHTNGLAALLEEDAISVERLILPAVAEAEFEELLAAVMENKGKEGKGPSVQVEFASRGDVLEYEETAFFCLHPEAGMKGESNVYSACYLVETKGLTVLLTADVEAVGENLLTKELKRRGITSVDVLKVAHHGSKYSTSEEFLAQIDVRLAVISCGDKNPYGHPHAETLERLENDGSVVLSTAKLGAITVEAKKENIEVSTFY